jgi:hypothetical protein
MMMGYFEKLWEKPKRVRRLHPAVGAESTDNDKHQ